MGDIIPISGLSGPYSLDNETIDAKVTVKSAGAYALGETKENTYYISYVGRSDDDVNSRLKNWVGSKYPQFKFEYYPSPKAAFEKECNLYHDFGPSGLDNKEHPDRPENSDWQCPRCDHFKDK